jgi:DNA-binding NarL/FixJ family response regulator
VCGGSSRVLHVARWLARGVSNLRIAHVLDCAERTVEVHVTRLLAKMECATRAEAIARTLA